MYEHDAVPPRSVCPRHLLPFVGMQEISGTAPTTDLQGYFEGPTYERSDPSSTVREPLRCVNHFSLSMSPVRGRFWIIAYSFADRC